MIRFHGFSPVLDDTPLNLSSESAPQTERIGYFNSNSLENSSTENVIKQLIKDHTNPTKPFNHFVFKRDMMLVALSEAKKSLSHKPNLLFAQLDKPAEVDGFIKQLENITVDELNHQKITGLDRNIRECLNKNRSTLFPAQDSTKSGKTYSDTIKQAEELLTKYIKYDYKEYIRAYLIRHRSKSSVNIFTYETCIFKIFEAMFKESSFEFYANRPGIILSNEVATAKRQIILERVKTGFLGSEDNYKIFQTIFITQASPFEDLANPITAEMTDIIISLLEKDKIHDYGYEIFLAVCIRQHNIFKNLDHPLTQRIIRVLTKLIENINFCHPVQSYDIFKSVFIYPEGIFKNLDHPLALPIAKAMLNNISQRFESNHCYEIFKLIFIESAGIFKNTEHSLTKEVIPDIMVSIALNQLFTANNLIEDKTQLRNKHKMTSVYNYEIFRMVFIDCAGIFKDSKAIITGLMAESIIKLVEKFNELTAEHNYAIFKAIFITKEGIFNDISHDLTQSMIRAIINLVKNNINPQFNYEIFKLTFISPEGIFQDQLNPYTQQISNSMKSIFTSVEFSKYRQEIFIYYLQNIERTSTGLRQLELLLLNLLGENQIQEPEVITRLANRLASRTLNIGDTKQNIKFFIQLSLTTNLPLSAFLFNDINYFIHKDGLQIIKQVITNNLLIKPLAYITVQQLFEQQIITRFRAIENDIQENIVKTIIEALREGTINTQVDAQLKDQIHQCVNNCSEEEAFKNITEDKLLILLLAVHHVNSIKANPDTIKQIQLRYIKNQIIQYFFARNDDLTELQVSGIEKLAESLATINIQNIQQQYLHDTYLSLLGINKDKYEEAYTLINQYLAWDNAVSQFKENKYKEISAQIIGHDKDLQKKSEEIYYCYVLSTLPYRSYSNILDINNNDSISNDYKQKFNLIIEYCRQNSLAENDDRTLNIFIAEKTEPLEAILISLDNLDYLNDHNIQGFSLEQFKVIFCTNSADNNIKFDPQPLGLNHLSKIKFTNYLLKLISNKFTAANIVAHHIFLAIETIIADNTLKITPEQSKQILEICYQVALGPAQDINIPLAFKQQLINDFHDYDLLITETETKDEHGNIEIIPAGDFIQIKSYLETELSKYKTEEMLTLVPVLLIEKSRLLKFTKHCDTMIERLFEELNKLPSLTDKISKYEIAYILGAIFMSMSSIKVLGYHSGNNNTAFARFRLLGAYWLAHSVNKNDNWSTNEKAVLSMYIRMAILTVECSGLITNNLYGQFVNPRLADICTKAQIILQAKINTPTLVH